MGRTSNAGPISYPVHSARGYSVQPGWRLLIQDVGLNPEAVLRRALLPADLLARSEGSLDSAQFFSLWRGIESESHDQLGVNGRAAEPIPLRIAQRLSADWFDPLLFSALCSADLIAALERVAKYKRLICPMALNLDVRPDATSLTIQWLPSHDVPPAVLVGFELAFFVQLARMATRTRIVPLRVEAPAALEPAEPYSDFFGVPFVHGPSARLVFSNEDARRAFLTVKPGLWDFFEPALRRRLAELDARASTVERLRGALLEALPAGSVGMEAISRKLGLSTRTLQRRLRDEGTSFQRTLDSVRGELALHYLKHSTMSGAEISFLLGFEDPNSFVRAFQGWTGQTPERIRQRLRVTGADGTQLLS